MTFNEITQRAVREAFEHPRQIDQNLVDAQQARRVLDRLVGYQVSPLLWDKVRRGLSAGRVQTVALRLIVEREREIKAFEKKEYWTIDAHLAASKPPAFDARFVGRGEEKIEVRTAKMPRRSAPSSRKPTGWFAPSTGRNAAAMPPPPFTTSKLQQDSSRKLRFSVKRTMMIAQRLYEGVELGEEGSGRPHYLYAYRFDPRVKRRPGRGSRDGRKGIRPAIPARNSPTLLNRRKARRKRTKRSVPPRVLRHPDHFKQYLKEDEFKVYKLIWQRFVASQIIPAVFDQTTVDIDAKQGNDATGSV